MDLSSDGTRLLLSFLLGMAVGLEREIMDKPAGLRTNVLICLGSTLFTLLSTHIAGPLNDPGRVAAQIVTGIGFLGAGAIMREGGNVIGLTTAATIWVVAAIGMAVGLGYFRLASLATAATLAVQILLTRLDILVDNMRRRQTFRIVCDAEDKTIDSIGRILKVNGIRVMHHKVMKRGGLYHSEWWTTGSTQGQVEAVQQLLNSEKVKEVTY